MFAFGVNLPKSEKKKKRSFSQSVLCVLSAVWGVMCLLKLVFCCAQLGFV